MADHLKIFLAALIGGLVSALTVVVLVLPAPAVVTSPAPAPAPRLVSQDDQQPAGLPELPTPVDLRAAARRAAPAVVHINALTSARRREVVKSLFREPRERPTPREGEGSGVIYTSNGYIVTNAHVVEGATEITVTTADRRTYPASLVGEDPKSDLAVLRIDATDLPFLELADSDQIEPGAWVLAVGNPLGLTGTVTAGIISARGRNINLLPDLDAIESFLQTDAAVNPGNSGGALVTASGKLVGINTAIASKTGRFQGYSFAIPVNLVRRVADDLIEFGSYRRAFLGVEISTFTRSDQRRLRIRNRTQGVVIDEIFAGGSAAAAGLLINDLIVRVDDRPIRDVPELTEVIGRAQVGDKLKVTVVRNGTETKVIVPLLAGE